MNMRYHSGDAVELSAAESSLYGTLDRVRQMTNASIRRFVNEHRELLSGRVLDYGAGKAGTCRIPQPFRDLIQAREYCPWEVGDAEPGGGFDAILCTQVIQNFDLPHGRFWNFGAWLKRGGSLVLTYPVAWQEIEAECFRYTQHGIWTLCHKAELTVKSDVELCSIELDGSLHLSLVRGAVITK